MGNAHWSVWGRWGITSAAYSQRVQEKYSIKFFVVYVQLFCKFEIFQNNLYLYLYLHLHVVDILGWNYNVFQTCQDTGTQRLLWEDKPWSGCPKSRIRVCLLHVGSLLRCRRCAFSPHSFSKERTGYWIRERENTVSMGWSRRPLHVSDDGLPATTKEVGTLRARLSSGEVCGITKAQFFSVYLECGLCRGSHVHLRLGLKCW